MSFEGLTDKQLGLRLLKGPINPVFKDSRVPDYRIAEDPTNFSASNRARYEIYLEALARVGVDLHEFLVRTTKGLRFKDSMPGSNFKDLALEIVHDDQQVVQ